MKKFSKTHIWLSLLIILLLLLAACSGGLDEAVEDTSQTNTSSVDDTTESEAIEDNDVGATGSEGDSGALPPTPDSGSKTNTVRATPNVLVSADTAVITPSPPANRIESDLTTATRQLDIVFLLDATGSMADELGALKTGLGDIAATLASSTETNNILIRYGFVIYRDEEKSDSGQLFELTDDWTLFAENLTAVTAVGGGDYPEDLNKGLNQAVTKIDWGPEAQRLIILLGDAPPHLDIAEAVPYDETIFLAKEQNITIFTIGSDGLNEPGVLIYQQIAQASNGRFSFVSNDPENVYISAASIQSTTNLPAIIVGIVLEVLNEEMP